ncbi:MAG: hypothetical protein ACXAAH_13475 [Promethearchaeota archaeon]
MDMGMFDKIKKFAKKAKDNLTADVDPKSKIGKNRKAMMDEEDDDKSKGFGRMVSGKKYHK